MSKMDPPKMPAPPSTEALFKFQVVSDVLSRVLRGEVRADAIASAAGQVFVTGDHKARSVGVRTIYRWLNAYENRDLTKLEPASRKRTQTSVVLSKKLLDFVAEQKRDDIAASLPEILRRAKEIGIIGVTEDIDRSTLYRACQRMGVPVVHRAKARVRDSRRFAYPHRMQMILCDGKHFRAGATRAKRVAMFFLDDASRLGLHVVVGTAESRILFLRGLFEMIQHHGIPGIVYLDHGTGYTADDTVAVIAKLKSLLIHGEVAYPEGRGKIERFNRTALAAVLRNLDGRADVDPACAALELRLRHWLRQTYNHTEHESLPDKVTPWQRFAADAKPLNLPKDLATLRQCFVLELQRKVGNDHIVSVDGIKYETPRGLAGTTVRIWRHVLDGTVCTLQPDGSGRLVQLHPVDLAGNAQLRGPAPAAAADQTVSVPVKSAADLAFEREFRAIVGVDGGFCDPNPSKDEEF